MEVPRSEADIADVETDYELNEVEEYEAWKAREIARIKRDRDDRDAMVKEREEIERVRNMTEEERRAWERKNPKPAPALKQKWRFMQKYYHKGAFFQDDPDDRSGTIGADGILCRYYSAPTGEEKMDKSILPKVMKVKHFGRSGRSKWTHLVNEDITDWNNPWTNNDPLRAKCNAKMAGMNAPIAKPKEKILPVVKRQHLLVCTLLICNTAAMEVPRSEADIADVETDDELNEAEEYEAWKARENARIKRDRDDRDALVKEREEIERVRKMTEEERREWERKNPEPAPALKQKWRFMQKYYHKGAFFQDDPDDRSGTIGADGILCRYYSAPTGEEKMDKSILPKVMQVKHFGRSGRTKWTHLVNEDITDWNNPWTNNDPLRAKCNAKMAGMNAPIAKPKEKILPVVKRQHLLVCTLLICNTAAMEVPRSEADIADVETDDELNEAEEYEAWKARENARIKRDRDDRDALVKEREEIERVRKMTEEERREWERKNPKPAPALKQKWRFMQKYYHKGAFFQDDPDDRSGTIGADGILCRYYSAPTGEEKMDKSILPKVMQVKHFGRSGRTKWTHLVNEDITDWNNPWTNNDPLRAKYNTKVAGMNAPIAKPKEKILLVVKRQHLLLCTLPICNAAVMEALPIFQDSLVTAWGAILISVTLILLFGEIIPQSVCTRHGLAIGATVSPFVRILVCVCFPMVYPISKLVDYLLGHEHVALFRRAELKTLVNFHGNEAGKGGKLTHHETTIIAGALELTKKTTSDAMTPISETFTIDINAKLDRDLMNIILERGHSKIPVYYEQPTNIIGFILMRRSPVKNVTIRRIPKVAESVPLYDILNEFQKGHGHMAVVVRQCINTKIESSATKFPLSENGMKEVRVDVDGDHKTPLQKSLKTKRSFKQWKSFPGKGSNSFKGNFSSKKWNKEMYLDILEIDGKPLPVPAEEAVGVITMEDVIEELLQEEIFDETDHHFDDS